jgi:hypothetical protein
MPAHSSTPASHGNSDAARSGAWVHESRARSKERAPIVSETKDYDSRKREPKPIAADSAPPCKHKPCTVTCPRGQSLDNNGKCVATAVQAHNRVNPQQCRPGSQWNGEACLPVTESAKECPAWEIRDGLTCVNCAIAQTRAANLAAEARMAKIDMETACGQNPSGQQCQAATLSHDGAIQRYRMEYDQAPLACRTGMLPPDIL